MVINCAAEVEGKSERIEIGVDAVRRFMEAVGITGEEVQGPLSPD